jgi:hypothetical protein
MHSSSKTANEFTVACSTTITTDTATFAVPTATSAAMSAMIAESVIAGW